MKQATALNILKAGKNVFLTGAAGTGKTYVITQYIQWLRDHRIPVAVTASTGIAATHIGGTTIHSWSGIGVKDDLTEWDLDALNQKQHLVKRITDVSVLIIDEISMLAPHTLDMVDAVCKVIRQNRAPFGGMQVVLSGDFYQLPPVIRGQRKGEELFADSAHAWQHGDIRVCYLTEQFRQNDDVYANLLNDIRDGKTTSHSLKMLKNRIGATLDEDKEPTYLYTHNVDVDARNQEELDKLSTPLKVFNMTSKGRKPLLEALKKSILAPERLELKEGALVMFVKNDREGRFVNGTLGVIRSFSYERPVVETYSGKEITVVPEDWTIDDNGVVLASVTQLPLRLAWAITVHKSQGMTLDAAKIDLSKTFTPGQGYVALSRLRSLDGLVLLGFHEGALTMHPYITELDVWLRKESLKWEKVVERFTDDDFARMHQALVEKCGSIDPVDSLNVDEDDEETFIQKARKTHAKAFTRWTKQEERLLVQLHEEGLSAYAIGERLGRKVGGIQSRLLKLGLIDVIE